MVRRGLSPTVNEKPSASKVAIIKQHNTAVDRLNMAHVMLWIFEANFRAQRTLWKEANEEGGTML